MGAMGIRHLFLHRQPAFAHVILICIYITVPISQEIELWYTLI